MRIYRKSEILAEIVVKRNSNDCYIVEEIGGEHTVTLGFDILNAVAFEIDDYVVISGMRYYIRHNEDVTKKETSLGYSYTILFYDESYKLGDWQYFPNGVPERKKNFSTINGTAEFIVDSVLTCANKVDSGWTKGSILVTEPKTYNLQDKTLMEVLTEVANENKTELWIYGKQINIGRREYPSGGLVLFQGEGGGLIDLKLSAVDKTKPTTVIYPYGSDRNLGKDYGNDYLVLPGGQLSIEKNVDRYGRKEVSMQFEDIYPHGIFEVTKKIDNFTLQASGIDFNLTDQLLDGVEVVVTFQTGGLAGYDLNVVDKSWDNSLKQLKLKENKQENALKVPGDINFEVGDKFILTGIKMPQSYIDKAEEELYERAVAWLEENCDKKVQVDAPCDPIEFKNRGITIACGQMVGVYSEKLNIDREIRCTRVKRYLEPDEATTPYRYEITLSDFLKSPSIKDRIEEVEKLPEVIKEVDNKARDLARRNWQDVKELAEELPAMFTEFSESINPVSVNAMQMYLGAEELQYMFVASKTSDNEVQHDYFYNKDTKIFSTPAGWVRHMTIGIDTLKPSHELGEYKHWLVSAFESAPLLDGKSRWLYIKASKSAETAEFMFSETKIEHTGTHYYFIVGFLNSERDGDRSWSTMYGWSEWTPGVMRVNRLSSTDGSAFLDLLMGVYQGRLVVTSATGYDNFEDKPDLNQYATNNFVNNVTKGLETQIDGKVETWFQPTNPWNGWASGTEQRHVGDLWYNTSTKELFRFIGPTSNNWGKVEDRDAIQAMQDASLAKDTADGKRRVFLSTPYPPYDAGDLWANGTDIRRCTTSRQVGSYNSNDWGLASNYDNTKVVIDNGVVTAGRIQLVGNAGAVRSGITGGGEANTSVRIWAGGTFEGRATANARITEEGRIYGRNSIIVEDANGSTSAGFSSDGTSQGSGSGAGATPGSIRLWVGGVNPDTAPFRVAVNGIVDANMYRSGTGHLYERGLHLPNGGQITVYSGDGTREFRLVTGSAYAYSMLDLKDTYESGTMFASLPTLSIRIGRAAYIGTPRTWISCTHAAGWGSRFIVESRYIGDADSMERTCINVKPLLHRNKVEQVSGVAPNFHNLIYDDNSGYICIE